MAVKMNDNNFLTIQAFMINDLKLKSNELLIYAIIYGFSQDGISRFTGSLQYLANWTNSTKNGVQKNLKSLLEKGFIEKFEIIKNGIRFCEYSCTPYNKVVQGIQQSGMGYTTKLYEGIQQSCTNNIDNNIDINIDINNIVQPDAPSTPSKKEVDDYFEELWTLYPCKKGKANISNSKKKELYMFGDEMKRAITRYIQYVQKKRKSGFALEYKNGSTFFNTGYVDYLDANYKPESESDNNKKLNKPNKFHNYTQRMDEYTAEQLEEIGRKNLEEKMKKLGITEAPSDDEMNEHVKKILEKRGIANESTN